MPDDDLTPFQRDRRRLILVGGFGAATYGVLRTGRVGPGGTTVQAGNTSTTTTSSPDGTSDVPVSIAGASNPTPADDHEYDIVIQNGRVIDPDSGYDAIGSVGIDGEIITQIVGAGTSLHGKQVIDASGLVVSPGFIDLMSYEPNDYGVWFKVADGVTTNLGMHGINATAEEFFNIYSNRVPVHFGGAFDNPHMRFTFLSIEPGNSAYDWDLEQLSTYLREGFDDGWTGLDFEPEYTPGVNTTEIMTLAAIAADQGFPIFFHTRFSDPERNLQGVQEVIDVARNTGAGCHIDHITSTGGTNTMADTLTAITAARDEGLDITADLYPYTFWATYLGSSRYGTDPETGETAVERFNIDYEDLQIVGTDEKLTEASFNEYRAAGQNPLVAALDTIPEADIEAALKADFTLIGSDAILTPGDNNHPRATGCFARTLGTYVRDRQTLSLRDALRKMTILPARRLETAAPVMSFKGRIQLGAHADITVFNLDTIADKGTVSDPAQESTGIEWVLVMGQTVKSPDGLHRDVLPGQAIRRT